MVEYIKNSDGSFMSPEQIVADLLQQSYTPKDVEWFLNDCNDPNKSDIHNILAKEELGRWIRNKYGMWCRENPYTRTCADSYNDIGSHPLFPDNLSATILNDMFLPLFKEKHQLKQKQPNYFAITKDIVSK